MPPPWTEFLVQCLDAWRAVPPLPGRGSHVHSLRAPGSGHWVRGLKSEGFAQCPSFLNLSGKIMGCPLKAMDTGVLCQFIIAKHR